MNDIQISYTHGSGGLWLSTVLYYCTVSDSEWVSQKINFHGQYERKINHFHHVDIADNVLSIGNGNYKYNFWKLYNYKKILHELTYKKVRGMRVVASPHNNYVDKKDDFFWLVNQCQFIQNYHCAGKFQIDWQNLFYNPEKSWNVICEFLEYNQVKNYRNIDQYLIALENYRNTCNQLNFNVNFKHKLFKIWALSFLQNHNYAAPADVFENFENPIINNWISDNKDLILDYTNANFINVN
jgi:hypothetical protein